MELTPKQQTIELINSHQRFLLVTPQNPNGDSLGSTIALKLILEKLGKEATIACPSSPAELLSFLPGFAAIHHDLQGAQDFIIAINTIKTKVEKIGYRQLPQDNKVEIVVTPKDGLLNSEDITFYQGGFAFEVIFVLDSPDVERLGRLYDDNAKLFYETPVINIDHHPTNDYFGKVNWVDLTATSTAEILVALLESLSRDNNNLLNEDVATCLLAGIIDDTGSFQNATTTPKALTVAAQLVAAGGRQQQIIDHLYRTKSLATLRLWGRILVNLREEKNHYFVWSAATLTDLEATGANESEISRVVDELMKTAPEIDFALLLSERQGNFVQGNLRAAKRNIDVAAIAKIFGGGGYEQAAAFRLTGADFNTIIKRVLEKIKGFQEQKKAAIAQPLITELK